MINTIPVKPGIGWGDDLQVKLQESKRDRWFPQIHSGWYYINNQEQYLFASEGVVSTTVTSGIYTSFDLSNLDIKNITRFGPVIIDGDNVRYTRVSSNMSVFNSYTPTSSGSNFLYINTPGEVVLVTDNTDYDYSEVSKISFLTEKELYYYDRTNSKIWISRDPDDPNRLNPLYLTYLKTQPDLIQEEILLVDSDGLIRTMLGEVCSTTTYYPVLVSTASGNIGVSGISNNTITPSGVLSKDTRIGVKYYLNDSFVITNDSTSGVVLKTLSTIQRDISVRYEAGFENKYLDLGNFATSGNSFVQINPMLNGIQSGFLHITPEETTTEYLTKLKLYTSTNRISSKQRQTLDILVKAISNENTLLSRVPISCWLVNASGGVSYPKFVEQITDIGQRTDFKGEIRFSWNPSLTTGTYTVYASTMSATGGILTSSRPIIIEDINILTDVSNSPKVLLYISPNQDIDGYYNLYVQLVSQTGFLYPNNLGINIYCKSGSLYSLQTSTSSGNTYSSQSLNVYFDGSSQNIGIKTLVCRYRKNGTDKIFAKPIDNKTDSNSSNWAISNYRFESTPLEIA